MKSINRLIKTAKFLNVAGPIIFLLTIIVLSFTNIILWFNWPCCETSGICYVILLYIYPIFLVINYVIHIITFSKEKGKQKIKCLLIQLWYSFITFLLVAGIGQIIFFSSSQDFLGLKSPDNKISYVVKDQAIFGDGKLSVNSGHIFLKRISNTEQVKGGIESYEVSWKDNESFNLYLTRMNFGDLYYSFSAPDKLEAITKEEYESQTYIKTEKY